MAINYLNIPYYLPDPYHVPQTRFLSIWKVEVNDQYKEFKPNGLGDPGIFITYEGQGKLITHSGEEYVLEANTFFFIAGNIPCRYYCPENTHWKFYFLHISDLQIAEHLKLPIHTVCKTDKMDFSLHQCERLIQCLIQNKTGQPYIANQLFQELLISFARERAEDDERRHAEISRIIYWMHKNIDQPIHIDKLVSMSYMSRTQFYKYFKKVTGMTPTSYFVKIKLEAAKIALQTTDNTIKHIAESLQFCDEFYFSKLFKKQFGVPPSNYRELYK